MLVVETIAKIRRAYFHQKKPIKQICRELKLSRKVVRKVIRSGKTEFTYARSVQPMPRLKARELKAHLLGRQWRIAPEHLDQYLAMRGNWHRVYVS